MHVTDLPMHVTDLPEPQEWQEILGSIPALEHPEFKGKPSVRGEIAQNYCLNNHSGYASLLISLLRNYPKRFTDEESAEIVKVAGKIQSLQAADSTIISIQQALVRAAEFGIEENGETVRTAVDKIVVQFLRELDKRGYLLLPAGSTAHSLILEITKVQEDYHFTFYNAGFGATPTGKTIDTHEARPETQPEVWGKETYDCKGDGSLSAIQKLVLGVHWLISHWLVSDKPIVYSAKDMQTQNFISGPVERAPTHAQSVENCSTRTTREYLRFNLSKAAYEKLYKMISGQDSRIDLKKVIETAPLLEFEHALHGLVISKGTDADRYVFQASTEFFDTIQNDYPERVCDAATRSFNLTTLELRNLQQNIRSGIDPKDALIYTLGGNEALFFRRRGNSLMDYNAHSDAPHRYR